MKFNLQNLKKDLQSLSLEELYQVNQWLQEIIKRAVDKNGQSFKSNSGEQIIEERVSGDRTYRLEYIRCGKSKCKCGSGSLHGPYWYAYWTEKGKTKSRYIGKNLPNTTHN